MIDMLLQTGSRTSFKMGAKLFLLFVCLVANSTGEMALENITRLATGDLFSLVGEDCGPTRCMEVSHGTALAALGDGCMCRCRRDIPAFREDRRVCVNLIDECLMASFGRGVTKPQIPFVFLPQKGQIIYPSKEIMFTDVEDAICAVTSAQYLSSSGWVTLRDLVDNDVPFGFYRDEGSTFLQWRGSAALHARLDGRLVVAHVLCSASTTSHLAASCAAFRVAGTTQNSLLDVRSIPFHAGEAVTTDQSPQSQGLSVLESLAIGVCVLMLIFIYAAGIIFYVHYKQKHKKKQKDPEQNMSCNSSENGSALESRIDMSNVMLKTNPLLQLGGINSDFMHDNGFSDASERTDDTIDSSNSNHNHINHKFQKMNSNVISAMVHSKKVKKPPRPSLKQSSNSEKYHEQRQRRSSSPDTFERAPQSDLSIVDCSVEHHIAANRHISSSDGEQVIRRKLYFNPVFFETEHLKNPPPAAVEFLVKIREVMSIAKDKMTSKRFLPMLSDIPEEDFYQSVDLGWDLPCARRGRRFSAISLKQENSRKAEHCGGCPGCDSKTKPLKIALTRSNSCKSCVSEDYKQRIVRKWLDEVPIPSAASKPVKSIAKVNGTPKTVEPNLNYQDRPNSAQLISQKEIRKHQKEVIMPLKEELKPQIETNSSKKSPKITEAIPKKSSKLTDIIPNITAIMTESIPTKTSKAENKSNKPMIDSVPKENPNLLVEKANDIENSNVINIENNENEDIALKPAYSTGSQERKSPSKHASRRIRKKLPPPPPPPTKPSEVAKLENTEPIPPEVKVKMEAVIRELNDCRRVEPIEIEEMKLETIQLIPAPKIVIPVVAADSHYFSDDNMLFNPRKTDSHFQRDNTMDFDSLERTMMRRRRFSLACGPELNHRDEFHRDNISFLDRQRVASSWLDMNRAFEDAELPPRQYNHMHSESHPISEIIIGSSEPLYDNVSKLGPLTIQVRGSPVETRRNNLDDFDPDTLDRKPKRDVKKRVEKILLKSAGSFKHKSTSSETDSLKKSPEVIFKNSIGNLRQIYESRVKTQDEENQFYKRRGSLQYAGKDLAEFMKALKTPDLIRHLEGQKDPKPPIPPKYRHGHDLSPKFGGSCKDSPPGDRRRSAEDRDRFGVYSRAENLNARRSGRRNVRTRSRRTDLRKLHRTEDSGYMSTDSNESKRRAKYLMQLRPKNTMPEISMFPPTRTVNKAPVMIESDTDELESLCDGRSESGGESVETDSVFFGHFDDSKELLAELGLHAFEPRNKVMQGHEQIDSGFMGETNIILSGDSDSEHRSVISIMTGRESRPPGSMKNVGSSPYKHTIEC